jgi:hypothetical protein
MACLVKGLMWLVQIWRTTQQAWRNNIEDFLDVSTSQKKAMEASVKTADCSSFHINTDFLRAK